MKTAIIIPTYNERENIGRLMTALQNIFARLPYDLHIVVVDDDSPDGTGDSIRVLMEQNDSIHLLTGPKTGLGTAYIRGMTYAMEKLNADLIFEMDADFSHDPNDIPRLLHEIEQGSDFVIGSRYVPGGVIPREWHWSRKLNSRLGNIVARYVTGMTRIKDCTAGFRVISASLLRKINLGALRTQGYAFQVALLHQAFLSDATIREIPVVFRDRVFGKSKLGFSDIIEFFINAWWLRLESSQTFIKFGMVGASGVVVNLSAYSLLLKAGVHPNWSSLIAIETSILSNFFLNNAWTFQYRATDKPLHIRGIRFNIVSLLSLSLSFSTFITLRYFFPDVPSHFHQLAGILPATLTNYFLNSYWTFHSTTNQK